MPKRVSVELELPDDVAEQLRNEDVAAKVKEALLMELLREHRISQGRAGCKATFKPERKSLSADFEFIRVIRDCFCFSFQSGSHKPSQQAMKVDVAKWELSNPGALVLTWRHESGG